MDLLIFNCSNLPSRPIYPYAFIQIGAAARLRGLSFLGIDLICYPREKWRNRISYYLCKHNPKIVGFHIRQLDTCEVADYVHPFNSSRAAFLPLEWTKHAIEVVRSLSNVPIAVGGIGFSFQWQKIMPYLDIDIGVIGDIDPFLDHFNEFTNNWKECRLENVVLRSSQYNVIRKPHKSPPPNYLEYSITEANRFLEFYSRFCSSPNHEIFAPVEVSRGCRYSCYFCGEPYVKGKEVRWRDFDIIQKEILTLYNFGIHKIWTVCSELNPKGDRKYTEFVNLMSNLKSICPKLQWTGYLLPYATKDELTKLNETGYILASNSLLSLDAENLKRAKVPYNVSHAKRFLKLLLDRSSQGREKTIFSMFLGNTQSTEKTISNTIRNFSIFDLNGANVSFEFILASRGYLNPHNTGIGHNGVGFNFPIKDLFEENKESSLDFCKPTFFVPKYLTKTFYNSQKLLDFGVFINDIVTSQWDASNFSISLFQSDVHRLDLLTGHKSTWKKIASYIKNNKDRDYKPPNNDLHFVKSLTDLFRSRKFHEDARLIEKDISLMENYTFRENGLELTERLYNSFETTHDFIMFFKCWDEGSIGLILGYWLTHIHKIQITPSYRTVLFPKNS